MHIIILFKITQWKTKWRRRRLAGLATRVSAVLRRHTQRHLQLRVLTAVIWLLMMVARAIMRTRVGCNLLRALDVYVDAGLTVD